MSDMSFAQTESTYTSAALAAAAVSAKPFRDAAAQLEARRQQIDMVEEMAGGVFTLVGRVIGVGLGESVAGLQFPVTFTEKPNFTYGAELGQSSPIVYGSFPTCSAVLAQWAFRVRQDTGRHFYQGVSLLIRVTGIAADGSGGVAGQTMDVHYRFEGKALRSPVQ